MASIDQSQYCILIEKCLNAHVVMMKRFHQRTKNTLSFYYILCGSNDMHRNDLNYYKKPP